MVRRVCDAPGGGVLPYMDYVGMCGPKRYDFSAVLVINKASISASLVINRVWLLHSSLDMDMLFKKVKSLLW